MHIKAKITKDKIARFYRVEKAAMILTCQVTVDVEEAILISMFSVSGHIVMQL